MGMTIISFKQVGILPFGIERQKARQILGSEYTSFQKTQWSITLTDNYPTFGLHLYYTEQDELEFVEMFPPAEPIFEGINLLQGNIGDIVEMLREFDTAPEIDGPSYTFHKIGISLYSEREDKKVEAVSAFSENYYSD